jgi:FkbH-like protein
LKLIEALKILKEDAPPEAEPLGVFLACGFMPVHLETFLAAHLRQLDPSRRVVVETGAYGDLAGNLGRLSNSGAMAGAVVLEWADLDPRLGLRGLGGWSPASLPDILHTVQSRLRQLSAALARAAERRPVALCLPTLPLPPFAPTAGGQASMVELHLRESVAAFGTEVAGTRNVKVVNPQRLDRLSPPGERLDVKSELLSGFPYAVSHADAVAGLLAWLIRSPQPKKGLIADLDDTLWRGILGEVGVEGVSWSLDHHSHMHGLYQQLLRSLAEAGILLAVASRNNPELVEQAFRRSDILLPRERVFPFEVHWGRKSESVERILRAWNVGADSVVLVDDSPMELAEVKAAHPDVECLPFPTQDDAAAYELLERLRDLFGKERVSEEDALRLASLRRAGELREAAAAPGVSPDEFLQQAEATLTLDFAKAPDPRAFELVNKTNQFNLNGRRLTEGEWLAHLDDPASFLAVAAYEDKYGPLGKTAVLLGRADDARVAVDTWVMSCRAFGRRIEHRCLEQLFAAFGVETVTLDYQATPRNGPLREFLAEFLAEVAEGELVLSEEQFAQQCPRLFQRVVVHGAPGQGSRNLKRGFLEPCP